jgi:Ca-activated chloride channel family protein
MDRSQLLNLLFPAMLGGAALGCGADETTAAAGEVPAARNVVQGGSQDIGEFRRRLAAGEVPPLDTLDEVGFFAEHAIDLPPATCGASVCAHPMLAVAPRFDGGNWTMGFLGMNTPVAPEDLTVGRRHILVVIENSWATRLQGGVAELALATVSSALGEADRVSVVEVTDSDIRVFPALPPEQVRSVQLEVLPLWSEPDEDEILGPLPHDLQRAVADARAIALDPAFSEFRQRVLVLTSGLPAGGATTEENMEALALDLASHDVGVSTFGYGAQYRRRIPLALAEAGAGNAYVATNARDLRDALRAEAATGFVPLARDLTITAEAQAGYEVEAVYGARRARVDGARAVLTSPVLFMGARSGSGSTEAGRRGGGGGWFVQLKPASDPGTAPEEDAPVLRVQVSYTDALTGAAVTQETVLVTPLGVGNNPAPQEPFFTDAPRAKPFMMLNMLMALRGAVSYHEQGACALSVGMRDMMRLSYDLWQQHYDDVDIRADFELLDRLANVVSETCNDSRGAVWPVQAQVSCFYF